MPRRIRSFIARKLRSHHFFVRIANPYLSLLAMTGAAVLVHGYHLGVDDAAIYVPAVKQAARPGLYPFGAEFFMSHAHLSLLPALLGGFARVTGLSTDLVIFASHVLSIFLLLLAAWRLACACFRSDGARWGGVGLLAAVLATPVAGTALVIMDPYVTARSFSAPATLFSIAYFLSNRPATALLWLLFTALVHPQMFVFGAAFLGCMAVARRLDAIPRMASVAAVLPFIWSFEPVRGPAREALFSRTYFFVSQWTWYEWLGAIAPVLLLWWFQYLKAAAVLPPFRRVARAIFPFSALFTATAIFLNSTSRLENYTRWQPMRAFHLVYLVFFVLLGGLVAEHLLCASSWRWLALFVPLAMGMHILARLSFPFSPTVELPGVAASRNNWMGAFLWIRRNTPQNAIFALDPDYMAIPGDDQHGFRAVAERSVLADQLKDSGAVSLFPELARRWKPQVEAQTGWDRFGPRDFERLEQKYNVTWVIVRRPNLAGLRCPYRNPELAVCYLGRGTCEQNMDYHW
jgi:hypothetical protein